MIGAAIEPLESRVMLSTSPLSNVPALNSRPSAPATIYLDFTGSAAFTWDGVSVPATPAFDDVTGSPITFSSAQLADINEIWSVVADAYSPFNINVTTVDPDPTTETYPVNQAMRIVVGGDNTWTGENWGGISVDGSFSDPGLQRDSFVFSDDFDGLIYDIGEICAHEAGHEFGLDVQSAYSGTTQTEYFDQGTAAEAPIMGVSYYSTRGVWTDQATEASSTTMQDDLAIISSSANGFGYAPITVGQSLGTASPLSITSGTASAAGVIENTTQTDCYSFNTSGGSTTLNVNVPQYGATPTSSLQYGGMLHAQETLYNAAGQVVATADNANTLGQTITANLTAGNYYLVVASYGGYSDIGQYTISGTVPQAAAPTFSISGASSVNEQATYNLALSASDPGQTVLQWTINWGDGNTQVVSGNPSSVAHTFATGPNSYTISATATDGNGTYSAENTVTVNVGHVAPTLSISGASSVNEQATYTLGLSGSDPGHTILDWTINWGDGDTQVVSGDPNSVVHDFATGPNTYLITATATDDVGTYAAGDTVSVNVAHVAPTLSISGASSVNERTTYTLGLLASDPGHTILDWTINWGDGDTQVVSGNPSSVTHDFATGPNAYLITATATDDVGTYGAGDSVSVNVTHVAPTLSISGASSVNEQATYSLGLSASDPGHTILDWTINWGDGDTQVVSGDPSSVTHDFATGPNAYLIIATATDDVSTYSAANTVSVNVAHVAPTLSISGEFSVNDLATYTLIFSASDPGHTILDWTINWGDGDTQVVTGNPGSVGHVFSNGPIGDVITATATDDVGTYAAGNSVSVNIVLPAPVLTISPPPTSGGGTQAVQLSWTAVAGATTYQVFRSTSDDFSTATKIGAPSGLSFGDTTATAGTLYYYWVRARNSAGFGLNGASETGYIPLAAPGGLTAVGMPHHVQLTWNSVAGAASYQLFRSTTDDINAAVKIAGAITTNFYDDSTAVAGVTYYYWIRARNPVGLGFYSVAAVSQLSI